MSKPVLTLEATDAEIGEKFRARCKELHQKLGRDAMLRQNDPVETITEFAWSIWQEGYSEGYDCNAYKQGYADGEESVSRLRAVSQP